MKPEISVIVPIYNEEENLPLLAERLSTVMRSTGRSYECLFVDDGSSDRSVEVARSLKNGFPELKIVRLRRNFGQTAALAAGFDSAAGDIIVTLDADLQNDPADIPMLLEKISQGYDLVNGWRKRRRDPWLRVLPSVLANRLISRVTRVRLHDYGCTLKAYRKSAIQDLQLYGQMHRFIPALASWAGVSLVEVPVNHLPRLKGKSKYGIARTLTVILDLITVKFFLSYSTSPIQIFGRAGLISSGSGLFSLVLAIVLKITQDRTLTGNPLFYFFIFMEIIAVQFILIGLVAEVNIRTYHESQKKKTYVIKEII